MKWAKKLVKNLYISIFYFARKLVKWKKINNVYLNIESELITRSLFGNIAFGDYEIDENKILRSTLEKDDILLELGTGLGLNSISAAIINNNKVITYEGNPNLIPLIRLNMHKNCVDFSLKNEIVLSKMTGDASYTFNVVKDFWSSSTKSNIGAEIIQKVEVPTSHINNILRDVNPSYLVVDIEGGEEDFFEDCSFLIKSSIKKILVELHSNIIGEEKCSMVIQNIIKSGFKMQLDSVPKNVIYFYK